eukprot:6179945-Pleurochrysis_carterae.AAC.2
MPRMTAATLSVRAASSQNLRRYDHGCGRWRLGPNLGRPVRQESARSARDHPLGRAGRVAALASSSQRAPTTTCSAYGHHEQSSAHEGPEQIRG